MTSPPPRVNWKSIRADVLERIQSGIWPPGHAVPKEADLSAHYGCTRSTVGRALRDLAQAGFLDRRRRGGTMVAANPVRKAPLEVPIIGEAIRKAGFVHDFRILRAEPSQATETEAVALSIRKGAAVFRYHALHLADGMPFQYESRTINLDTAPELARADLSAMPIDEWLLRNRPLERVTIEISAVPAGPEAASLLETGPDVPVLLVRRVSWARQRSIGLLHLYHRPGHMIRTGF
ncbi:MAG: GntR family transcriptional regulator [Pseudorhodobacter sp.]